MSLYSFVGAVCQLPYDISARGSFLKRRRTPKQVLDEIEEKGVAFVDLHLTDVPGRLRHVTIPADVTVSGRELRARGEFDIKRSDFNVKATSAFHGTVRVRDTVEPDPEWSRVYDEGYGRFRRLYPSLRSLEEK